MTDHTPTPPQPLSVAAQMVLNAFVETALPPFRVIARPMAAAAIRALVEQTLPVERSDHTLQQTQRQRTRIRQLAIAAELDGAAPQPTPTETTDD